MNIREDLKAFVDGELPPARAAEVRAAVEADPLLAEEVRFLSGLGNDIRGVTPLPAAKGLESTLSAIQRRPAFRWLPSPVLGGLLSVVAVAGIASVVVVNRSRSYSAAQVVTADAASRAMVVSSPATDSEAANSKRRAANGIEALTSPNSNEALGGLPSSVSDEAQHEGHPAKPVQKQSADLLNMEHKVSRTAALRVLVDDVKSAEEKALRLITNANGVVGRNRSSNLRGMRVTLTYKFPSSNYEGVLKGLQELGDATLVKSSAEDFTNDYAKAQEKHKRSVAQTKAANEKEEARLRYLSDKAEFSTITVTFVVKPTKNAH